MKEKSKKVEYIGSGLTFNIARSFARSAPTNLPSKFFCILHEKKVKKRKQKGKSARKTIWKGKGMSSEYDMQSGTAVNSSPRREAILGLPFRSKYINTSNNLACARISWKRISYNWSMKKETINSLHTQGANGWDIWSKVQWCVSILLLVSDIYETTTKFQSYSHQMSFIIAQPKCKHYNYQITCLSNKHAYHDNLSRYDPDHPRQLLNHFPRESRHSQPFPLLQRI